ncbi:MAG: ATP-binding protein [Nitriliruptoraceae bacterium]
MTAAYRVPEGRHAHLPGPLPSPPDRWSLAATVEDVPRIRAFVGEAAERRGASAEATFRLSLVVDELCTNVIVHGYDGGPGPLELSVHLEGEALAVTIRDEAPMFDPTTVQLPAVAPCTGVGTPGGRGLMIVDQLVDRLEHGDRGEHGLGNLLVATTVERWSD